MTATLPKEFLESLQRVTGFDPETFRLAHENGKQSTSIRMNPMKPFDLSLFSMDAEPVPWSSFGYYLPQRPSFTLDPLLHGGAYYVQEASGMFLEQCLRQSADLSSSLKVLDLCAAPGGKSTLIQSLISQESLLVSNEVIKTRVNTLEENISKWGGVNNLVTNNDPRDFRRMENYFDIIAVDAPCSGSGLFRRDEAAIDEWSLDAVKTCSLRQQRILTDIYPALKQHGVLIYSTCSYSAEEDEDISDWLCDQFGLTSLRMNIPPSWNITETKSGKKEAYGYRFFSDKLKGEGFYISCFKKEEGEPTGPLSYKKQKWTKLPAKDEAIVRPWIKDTSLVNLYYLDKEIFAFPRALEEELIAVSMSLYLKKAGVLIGKIMHGELIPAHELAVSGLLSGEIVVIPLKKEQALQYLRREAVTIDSNRRGWAIVQYEGINLGWIKILDSRINNYYPKEWRILKSGNK